MRARLRPPSLYRCLPHSLSSASAQTLTRGRSVFTRLRWLIGEEGAFNALMPSAHFRDAFGHFVHDKHSALSTQWTCSLELSAADSESGADRSDRLREIYQKLTGESSKGKALHVLVDVMEKIVQPLNEVQPARRPKCTNTRDYIHTAPSPKSATPKRSAPPAAPAAVRPHPQHALCRGLPTPCPPLKVLAKDVFPDFLETPAFLRVLEDIRPDVVAGTLTLPDSVPLSTFEGMLEQATRDMPFAICVADMHQPGAPLVSVNLAFTELTGYPEEECLCRNCRFMQGEETEQDAVLQLVEALRAAEPVQLEMTNYKKNGSAFVNLLSLQPVHDSRGAYRYCIAISADSATLTTSEHTQLARLRRLLPNHLEFEIQPLRYDESLATPPPATWLEKNRGEVQVPVAEREPETGRLARTRARMRGSP